MGGSLTQIFRRSRRRAKLLRSTALAGSQLARRRGLLQRNVKFFAELRFSKRKSSVGSPQINLTLYSPEYKFSYAELFISLSWVKVNKKLIY